jgi:hypothetical protein
MKQVNNFEKNRRALKDWMVEHEVFNFKLSNPVRAEVFYPGNRNEDSIPEIVYCQNVILSPRVFKGKIARLDLNFKDTNGNFICYNDLSDGNFYKNVLREIKNLN